MKNRYIAGLLGLGIVIAIICVAGIARKSLSIFKRTSIPVISYDHNFDEAVNDISYMKYLNKYIRTSEVSFNEELEKKKDDLVRELIVITELEDKKDIQQMSIDGREMAISLIKDIYRLYGVNILFDADIEGYRVKDKSGKIIYQSPDKAMKANINFLHLAIVTCSILVLLGLSILMTIKNRIYIKDGDFDGLNEKEYA